MAMKAFTKISTTGLRKARGSLQRTTSDSMLTMQWDERPLGWPNPYPGPLSCYPTLPSHPTLLPYPPTHTLLPYPPTHTLLPYPTLPPCSTLYCFTLKNYCHPVRWPKAMHTSCIGAMWALVLALQLNVT